MSSDVAIAACGLSKRYRIRGPRSGGTFQKLNPSRDVDFWALENVSFEVEAGRALGLVGPNGAGKSTLLKLLSRITPPTRGTAMLRGRSASLLEVGTGFHPELSGRENIFLNGTLLGMRRTEIRSRFDEIVSFSQVDAFLDVPVKRYSNGMYVRLAFAVAAHLRSDILLVDEVLAVGDAEFQRRSLGKMDQLTGEGRTIVFVSHSMESVRRICDSAILVDGGRVVAQGDVATVIDAYVGQRDGQALRVWSLGEAPGDERVRLLEVAVTNVDGATTATIDIRQTVHVRIKYATAADGVLPIASVIVRNSFGVELFGSNDAQAERPSGARKGAFLVACQVPGNLLAEGAHLVSVMLHGGAGQHVRVEDVVGFQVEDPGGPGTVRGAYGGVWTGVVRPWLEWQFSPLPQDP